MSLRLRAAEQRYLGSCNHAVLRAISPMRIAVSRAPGAERIVTPLELFFDLV